MSPRAHLFCRITKNVRKLSEKRSELYAAIYMSEPKHFNALQHGKQKFTYINISEYIYTNVLWSTDVEMQPVYFIRYTYRQAGAIAKVSCST